MSPVELQKASVDDMLRIAEGVFPGRRIDSVSTLEGGKTNMNVLIRIDGYSDMFVLRQQRAGAAICRKEVMLLEALKGRLPVPDLIAAKMYEGDPGASYLVYRYAPGETFWSIRSARSAEDMAQAALAIGACLARLDAVDGAILFTNDVPCTAFAESDLDSSLLQERLDGGDWPLLKALYVERAAALREVAGARGVCHGDFNHRNIVLEKRGGTWEVVSILDWENAGKGSIVWDAARFTCYNKPDAALWEDAFLAGLQENTLRLPGRGHDFLQMLNVLSAARSLSDPFLREAFVPELRMLIHAGLRGKRIG